MNKLLNNPIMVNIELGLLEDIIKIIGAAIHNKFSHDDIAAVKKTLIQKGQEAIDQVQNKEQAQ